MASGSTDLSEREERFGEIAFAYLRARDEAPAAWRWHGRPVKVIDGTTVSMPDTPANQQNFPQPGTQQPGTGFPLARLWCCSRWRWARRWTPPWGPPAASRPARPPYSIPCTTTWRKATSCWPTATTARTGSWPWPGGWDLVSRLHQRRRPDFRRGRRLGREDHVVGWAKPKRPAWLDEATYAALPDELAVREVRVRVRHRGFRTRVLVVVTTLLDAAEFPAQDVALLYRVRWYAALDLRALKQTMQMDVLRCHSPEMVRKEVGAHLLAYNLLRGLLARAALAVGLLPWELSFKGALQAVSAFTAVLWAATEEALVGLYVRLLTMLLRHRVADRPNRYEPRARKRRPKKFPPLTEPRAKARARLAAAG